MPQVSVNAPVMNVDRIPERPDFFYITETIMTATAASGEKLEIQRTPSPLIMLIKGERNEATVDLTAFFQEALLHVVKENDYTPPLEDTKPAHAKEYTTDHQIEVALLGSGYAAIHTVLVHEPGMEPYRDVQQTGVGRYKTRDEAVTEARMWSQSDEIPLAKDLIV